MATSPSSTCGKCRPRCFRPCSLPPSITGGVAFFAEGSAIFFLDITPKTNDNSLRKHSYDSQSGHNVSYHSSITQDQQSVNYQRPFFNSKDYRARDTIRSLRHRRDCSGHQFIQCSDHALFNSTTISSTPELINLLDQYGQEELYDLLFSILLEVVFKHVD